ncbi:MAG: hypothetical protein JWO56_177, partial [Acidobacteria bacterium]|nr:hypothetical protein [Acidobacteriota bacterium]
MKTTGRIQLVTLSAALLSTLSCSSHDDVPAAAKQEAVTRASPLAVLPSTILPTERSGATDPTLNVPLTDDLAPAPNVSVTPDGAAAVSLPLWVSPGRAGMQPDIALSYSSRGGLSAVTTMGPGWQLSGLPQIHRCARTAADSGATANRSSQITFTSSDQLCVDHEPLVPEKAGTTIYTAQAAFRPLHDDHRRFIIDAVDALGPTSITAYDRQGRATRWGQPPATRGAAGGWVQASRYSFQTNAQQPGYKNVVVVSTAVRYGWLLAT